MKGIIVGLLISIFFSSTAHAQQNPYFYANCVTYLPETYRELFAPNGKVDQARTEIEMLMFTQRNRETRNSLQRLASYLGNGKLFGVSIYQAPDGDLLEITDASFKGTRYYLGQAPQSAFVNACSGRHKFYVPNPDRPAGSWAVWRDARKEVTYSPGQDLVNLRKHLQQVIEEYMKMDIEGDDKAAMGAITALQITTTTGIMYLRIQPR
jgi:hypothetical protein